MESNEMNIIEQLENGTLTDKIIEIKSVYKNGKTTVTPIKDPFTGWYKGLERLSDEDKKKKIFYAEPSAKFVLTDGVTFDLSKEEHKVMWAWVKHQTVLAETQDECQSRPNCEFYIHLRNREAQGRVSARLIKHKAVEYILNDTPDKYPMRIKLLGISMDGEDTLIIKDSLLDIAEATPDRVIKVYEDKLVSLRLLTMAAVEKNIIYIEPGSGAFRYGNIILGMSEDTAVGWLNDTSNSGTLDLLERAVYPNHFKTEPKSKAKETPPPAQR